MTQTDLKCLDINVIEKNYNTRCTGYYSTCTVFSKFTAQGPPNYD